VIAPKDKERYARHAAPEAIRAELRVARERQQRAAVEVVWLERLLAQREQQVAAGAWPPEGEPDA